MTDSTETQIPEVVPMHRFSVEVVVTPDVNPVKYDCDHFQFDQHNNLMLFVADRSQQSKPELAIEGEAPKMAVRMIATLNQWMSMEIIRDAELTKE